MKVRKRKQKEGRNEEKMKERKKSGVVSEKKGHSF